MTGLVVIGIDVNSQAEKIGLHIHDVLYKCDEVMLNTTEDLISAVRATKSKNELVIIRNKDLMTFQITGSLGISLVTYPIPDVSISGVGEVMANFRDEIDAKSVLQRQAQESILLERISGLLVTTTPQLEGFHVVKTLNIITAEYVGGVNIFRDYLAVFSDLIGGRSNTLQNELRKARETCIADLKIEADRIGANAVIGVDLDYSEISGGGKSMLFIVASGTAVIVEPIATD